MAMMRRISLSCLLLAVLWSFIHAVQYPIIIYKTADGLPQNFVTSLAQDRNGYIWVGTQSGIGIFNGNDFVRTLSTMDNLPGSYINDLVLDDLNGDMWVATDEGIAVMNGMKSIAIHARGRNVLRVFPQKVGDTKCLALSGGRLISIGPKKETATLQLPEGLRGQRISHADVDSHGTISLLINGRVVRRTREGQWSTLPLEKPVFFLISRRDRLYLAEQTSLTCLHADKKMSSTNLPPGSGRINDLEVDEGGGIWLATETGLYSFHPGDDDWLHFHGGNGMSFSKVNRVMVDREHTVFAGTSFGLSFFSGVMFRMYNRNDGLPSEFITSLLEDAPGIILAGGYDGVSEIRNGHGRSFPINRRLRNKQIRCILKAGPGEYFLGTRHNGIFRWNRKNRLDLLMKDAHILSGLKSRDGDIWFGTDNGLLHYDGKREFQRIREGLRHSRIWTIAEWSPGVLILGTGSGLQVYAHNRFVHSDLETLMGNVNITDIFVAQSGEILVSTVVHGLFIYRDGVLSNFTTRNGLLHNDVWYTLKDSQGQIWLNTSVSLDRYHKGYFSHFNRNTGLFGDEGFIHTAIEASDGSLWLSVSPGLVELPPTSRNLDPVPPTPPDLSMQVNDRPLPTDSHLHLNSRQNTVEFSFFTVSTRRDQPLYYRWRLLPRQSQWQGPSHRTKVHYLNLPPSQYTFEVMADNGLAQRKASARLRRITFDIGRPIWKKWWFILLGLLALAVLMRLVTFLRLRMLESQKRRLEKRIHEHTNELARKNHELLVLSITDPLTGLKNRRYLDDRISDDVHLIERSLFLQDDKSEDGDDNARKIPSSPDDRILTFYVIDIDHFKSVNDIHGHHGGDRVLVGVAQTLRKELRTSDIIIRWGGEEFLVVTRNKLGDNSYMLAERLRQSIEAREFHISSGETVSRTVSIGFARYPFIHGDIKAVSWQQVISLADSAMYLAKMNGRNLSMGIEPGPGFTEVPFSQIITRMDEQAASGRIRLYSARHEIHFNADKTEEK